MKTTELLKILEQAGFVQTNKGRKVRHLKFRHPDGRTTMVSKGKGEIPQPTLRMIEKQTGLKLT